MINWSNPQIIKDNLGAVLPRLPITFVYRADGSGTTLRLTQHLEKVCSSWQTPVTLFNGLLVSVQKVKRVPV
ncbi:MAG: hypothetical protein IGS50_03550 [Synechococcales cyanobacterium C42_A2020_086]|nr:hypothetical protein [Synechococcales cyanobacterium C42_A2020_086]